MKENKTIFTLDMGLYTRGIQGITIKGSDCSKQDWKDLQARLATAGLSRSPFSTTGSANGTRTETFTLDNSRRTKETIHADQLADMLSAATSLFFGLNKAMLEEERKVQYVLEAQRDRADSADSCENHVLDREEAVLAHSDHVGETYFLAKLAMDNILKKIAKV